MTWPFRRRRYLNRWSVACELATYGRELSAFIVDANRRGLAISDTQLERRYAALIDQATERIMALEARR